MDKKFIEERKQQLLEEKAELETELGNIGEKSKHTEGDYRATFVDIGTKDEDSAVEVADYGDRLALEDELEKNLSRTNKALEKIESGTYGVCGRCGKEIEEERLEAFPAAVHCMECEKISHS